MRLLRRLLLCLPFLLVACFDDEDYSTSATDVLVSDVDTLRIDTVISGEPINTYTFRLYNPSSKYVRITQAYLEGGESSPFHVNIDGTVIGEGSDVNLEVGKKDSLSVFLMANIPDSDDDEPQFVRDKLVIVTEGGARTTIVLEASGQSVIKLHAPRITTETTWDAQRPYQIFDSLVVDKGCTLTLSAGTRLWMHPGANIIVRGTLRCEGKMGLPVTIRGDRLGDMFNNQSYDRIPGQWGGIVITASSAANYFNYADIHSGTFGLRVERGADPNNERVRVENSILHNFSGLCVEAESSNVFFGNSQISNGGAGCVTIRGGSATFVHCTIARFYAFTGGSGVALTFTNADAEGKPLSLKQALFLNSIITGYAADEVMAERAFEDWEAVFNFYFDHCLLDTDPVDDVTIANACLWDNKQAAVCRADNFVPAFDLQSLTFTFYLSNESQAIGTADLQIAQKYYPTDPLGHERYVAPDMGCYQHSGT